ncbi:type II toxin-antitoxin system antitoxin SocA domain-containing protein [uncultured Aquimarina sp.]|uniref:type II toxin-antitoxin system antitoxin SocA domain-containing protein n=1 Tax=uncultured Aquimarina sp. TaxID=575652 RepID=UPI00262DD656|nr:type II toxin-antitoxin system antitoxin SocA domain-containing protein [uncultured Aquimarina sp.]
MKTELSNKELGNRIMIIRKEKGLSQEELALIIGISRPSLAQVELGNRKISIIELMNLSLNLRLSIDKILSKDFELKEDDISFEKEEKTINEERISMPNLMVDKFRNILLYILERCAGKANVGETVLYKLLYFSDFNYYEIYENHLSGAVYRKLPYGPVPHNINSVIDEMIKVGEVKRIKTEFHGYHQTRYLPLTKPDLTELKASEIDVIDRVINQLSDYYASAISDYSHKDIPWQATEEGDVIDYELAFYREKPFSVRNYDNEDEDGI